MSAQLSNSDVEALLVELHNATVEMDMAAYVALVEAKRGRNVAHNIGLAKEMGLIAKHNRALIADARRKMGRIE